MWAMNIMVLYIVLFTEMAKNIYAVEILYMELYILSRCVSIACKYATIHK